MSIPPPPENPGAAAPPDPVTVATERRRLSPFLVALIAGCCVMLVATIALAATTLSLLNPPSASALPTPTPEPTADSGNRTQTVRGIEVVTRSEIEFGDYAMSDVRDGVYTLLVAPLSWSDQTSAIDASFDITAYDADGRIVNRNPTSTYILPGQEGFFQGIFNEDLSDVVRITVEQTRAEVGAPLMSGEIELTHSDSLSRDSRFYVGGNLTSTLSILPLYPDVFFAAYADGELFGYCSDTPDIPAGGEFVSTCELIPVTRDEHLLDDRIPKGAEFRAYLELDPISHEDY